MQSVSSRIWTRVAVCISYDDNHYTTGTSTVLSFSLPLLFIYLYIVLPRSFCTNTFKNSTDNQNLWCRGSISPKAILVLPKYFLYFRFYAVGLQSIADLGRYGSKGYITVVLGYSKVTLFRQREEAPLCPSVYCTVTYNKLFL